MTTAPHPVHLVGAGPGDPELLTLKALRVLRRATVILVDDLVGEAVLDAALADVAAPPRVVRVGKRGGCASTPQEFIEKLMVREALAGERVVRLKGGDPLVFGRAGEEIAALQAAGVEVEIVNGITSGLAAAGSAGIGWTDRRAGAQGVLLVTGHAGHGCEEPDWDAIGRVAASGVTLVVYMGVARVEVVVGRLRAALPGDLPVAVVRRASAADEVIARTTLDALVDTIRIERIGSPAILVIGRVASLAAEPAQRANVLTGQRAKPRRPSSCARDDTGWARCRSGAPAIGQHELADAAHPTNVGEARSALTLRGFGWPAKAAER